MAKIEARHDGRRQDGRQTEARQSQRLSWPAQRTEQDLEQRPPASHDRTHEPGVRGAISAQALRGTVDGPLQDGGAATVERVHQRSLWVQQLESECRQRRAAEKGRGGGERQNFRAQVVHEAGQRQLGRSQAAAQRVARLEHQH